MKMDKNKPKTIEELVIEQFIEQKETIESLTESWLEERKKRTELQTIVDTLKKHATFDYGSVSIFISESQKADRDFLVEALELKKEEKPNE
jgi:hypothetical protein